MSEAQTPWSMLGLLREAARLGASDLHVTNGAPPAVRTNGRIRPLDGPTLTPPDCERLVGELLSEEQRARFRGERALSFARYVDGLGWYRVNVYSQLGVMEAAVRASPRRAFSPDELGVSPAVGQLALRDSGLLLVTGPTGHGKTTTFNALIDLINRSASKKILTIEDPVEFRHEHQRSLVVQLEVGQDTPDFPTALRHALRQDPDVIGVGELRDLESISTAVTAAETGHLVLATLHTPSAPGTITRIVDVFPPYQQEQIRMQLASTLLGVVTQRLLPRADGLGRVLATEVLIATDAIRTQIRESKVHQMPNTLAVSRAQGMRRMDDSIRDFLANGVISPDTARAAVTDPKVIRDLL